MMASLAELELDLGRERRDAAKAARKTRNLPIDRPRALPPIGSLRPNGYEQQGEPVSEIAKLVGVSRPTMYRLLAVTGRPRLASLNHQFLPY